MFFFYVDDHGTPHSSVLCSYQQQLFIKPFVYAFNVFYSFLSLPVCSLIFPPVNFFKSDCFSVYIFEIVTVFQNTVSSHWLCFPALSWTSSFVMCSVFHLSSIHINFIVQVSLPCGPHIALDDSYPGFHLYNIFLFLRNSGLLTFLNDSHLPSVQWLQYWLSECSKYIVYCVPSRSLAVSQRYGLLL